MSKQVVAGMAIMNGSITNSSELFRSVRASANASAIWRTSGNPPLLFERGQRVFVPFERVAGGEQRGAGVQPDDPGRQGFDEPEVLGDGEVDGGGQGEFLRRG